MVQPALNSSAIRNARLPEELWKLVCTSFEYYFTFPLALDPEEYRSSLLYRLRGTCRALHRWCDLWEWEWVEINYVRQIKQFLRRLQVSPSNADLITSFEVWIEWPWEILYPHDWTICGSPETWMFADRKPKKREFFKEHVMPDETDSFLDAIAENTGWPPEGWNEGPDGEGTDELVKSAVHFQEIMGHIIEQLPSLQSIHWCTKVIPMTSRICRTLGRCQTLREVTLGPSGQCYTSLPQSPLWLLFEARDDNHPIETLILGAEILPSYHEFRIARDHLRQPVPQDLKYLKDSHLLLSPMSIPEEQYRRYLDYPFEDGVAEATLHFVERPLAMICRTLEASRGLVRQVQTPELQLAYVTNLWPIWAQTALVGYQTAQGQPEFKSAEDPRLDVIRELHECMRHRIESKGDNIFPLDRKALLASFQGSRRMQPFANELERDPDLLDSVWDSFVRAYRKRIPDWNRPPIDKSQHDRRNVGALQFVTLRDLPEAPPPSNEEDQIR